MHNLIFFLIIKLFTLTYEMILYIVYESKHLQNKGGDGGLCCEGYELCVVYPAPDMSRYCEGDLVTVKPVNAGCTNRWRIGRVIGVVLDLRGLGHVTLPHN
jgi:hypothetical protein